MCGRAVLKRPRRRLQVAGQYNVKCRRRHCAEAGTGRNRAREAQADGSLDAYDVYLRGMASAYRWTKEA